MYLKQCIIVYAYAYYVRSRVQTPTEKKTILRTFVKMNKSLTLYLFCIGQKFMSKFSHSISCRMENLSLSQKFLLSSQLSPSVTFRFYLPLFLHLTQQAS